MTIHRMPRGRSRSLHLNLEKLEGRALMASDFQNAVLPADVDGSGAIAPLDALLVINELNRQGGPSVLPPIAFDAPDVDVNGNSLLEPLDALLVINQLNGVNSVPASPIVSSQTVRVDVVTGEVTVSDEGNTSTSGAGSSEFVGNTIRYNVQNLIDQPGNVGRKVLRMSLTNQMNESIGVTPDEVVTGFRVLTSPIATRTSAFDVRTGFNVDNYAGTGVLGPTNGSVASAAFNKPLGIAMGSNGVIYVADSLGNRIRKIENDVVSILAGTGTAGSANGAGPAATFNTPWGITINPIDGALIVADYSGHRVRRVTTEGVVSTIAGNGVAGDAVGGGAVSQLRNPTGVAVDSTGAIYVTEATGHRVRKIVLTPSADPTQPTSYTTSVFAGSTTSVAGFAEGTGTTARFNSPNGIAIDSNNNLFVADRVNHRIRWIAPSGAVLTVAGNGIAGGNSGVGADATFNLPQGISRVPNSDAFIVTETGSNRIRQMTLRPGSAVDFANRWQVDFLAGTGAAGTANGRGDVATFNYPADAVTSSDGTIYVADFNNNRIRRIVPEDGSLSTGTPAPTTNTEPVQILNADGVIPNQAAGAALPYKFFDTVVEAGATSPTFDLTFAVPSGVTAFEFTLKLEAHTEHDVPVQAATGVGAANNSVRTYAGADVLNPGPAGIYRNGPVAQASFSIIRDVDYDRFGNAYVAEAGNRSLRRITPDGMVTTVAGVPFGPGMDEGLGSQVIFSDATIAVNPDGQEIFVMDRSDYSVFRVSLSGGDGSQPDHWFVTRIAGAAAVTGTALGSGDQTRFVDPRDIVIDAGGNLIISDGGALIRLQYNGGDRSVPANWFSSLIVGDRTTPGYLDGVGTAARLDPYGLAVDLAGTIFVTEPFNRLVRKVTLNGNVSTFAGNALAAAGYVDDAGTNARFIAPLGIDVDSAGYLYVSEVGVVLQNNVVVGGRVRRISPTGRVETVAGTGAASLIDGPGNLAAFRSADALALDPSGQLLVADQDRLRLIQAVVSSAS